MYYRSNTEPDPKNVKFGSDGVLGGTKLESDIKHLVKLMVNDNQKPDAPLLRESFVIAIQGSWGVGKTWASLAFINELSGEEEFKNLHTYSFELLPFANINESMVNILGSIGEELWDKGVVDVRKELSQMILDATPSNEYSAGISVLGVSMSKKFAPKYRDSRAKDSLIQKFIRLSENGHRFLVMLDDLDRLKPNEVVVVTRMIENFKAVPGFIFVLPLNREAVSNSIKEGLKLSEPSAHVFVRKFIKASISIELTVDELKQQFCHHISFESDDGAEGAIQSRFGINVALLTWYILLHMLLIREAIASMGSDPTGTSVAAAYNNSEASSYLFKLPQKLGLSKRPQQSPEVSSLPYATDDKFVRFAEVFGALSDPGSDVKSTIAQLRSLMNEQTLANYIYTNPQLIEELRNTSEVKHDSQRASDSSKVTVFEEILLPLMVEGGAEPMLTGNYSRRDMVQLANAISKDAEFSVVANPLQVIKNIAAVCRDRFEEFR